MRQAEFETVHQALWQRFERSVELLNGEQHEAVELEHFPAQYRTLCQHLAMAKSRRYSTGLTDKLNSLVQQGYLALYGARGGSKSTFFHFLFYGFPATLRANALYLWVATAVFLVPAILVVIACMLNDQLIYSIMDPQQVRSFESMYDPALRKLGRERQSDTDWMMFGYYIQNNIGVSFRCFATGIFFGLGSLFFIAFNGLLLGAVAGHLGGLGFYETFYPFVIGHGAFELTAIVFSGAAGMKIGHALVAPGSYTRIAALQTAAGDAIKIIYGSTIMLLIAAFLEAFWSSSSSLPIWVKLSVGAVLWVLVLYYCFYSGRVRRES